MDLAYMQKHLGTLVITTGGTIGAMPDHDFGHQKGFVRTMPPLGQDFVRDALQTGQSQNLRWLSHEPCDSQLMDEAYRRRLIAVVEEAPEQKILITHGTDTILKTADTFFEARAENSGLTEKTILLTGSMIPLTNGPESDGYLNINFSLEALAHAGKDLLSPGVYVVLCDYEKRDDPDSAWKPRLYTYGPGRYEKVYDDDQRYSRLRDV
jgi:L-asparaginase